MTRNDALIATLRIRQAVAADLPALLALIADDVLGKNRDADASDPAYTRAFARIAADQNQQLLVVTQNDAIVAMMQMTYIPGLSRRGATRANIEAVRVTSALRGQGVGSWFIAQAIARAQADGCTLAQLTSDKRREEAHAFYLRLGFTDSHIGFKRQLEPL